MTAANPNKPSPRDKQTNVQQALGFDESVKHTHDGLRF